MSYDDEPPPTNFVALTPRSSQTHRLNSLPPQPTEPYSAPVPPAPVPMEPPTAPTAPVRPVTQPQQQVGAGGFSGYQVNHSTTQLRVKQSNNQVWIVLGVLLGLGILAGGAVALALMGQ